MTALTVQMEAYAFRQLVAHLQWRDDVQNIDLMNLAGFCRNCLSKWYVAGAKVYGVPMDYNEATERIYGEPLAQFKKRQPKATEEQMSLFNSAEVKAKHARTDPGPALLPSPAAPGGAGGTAGHSNVCGQDCDAAPVPAPLNTTGDCVEARIAILTCSDRASQGVYKDESGPAVKASVSGFAERSGILQASFPYEKIVPDDEAGIASVLRQWSESQACDVIITTGGTGFAPRDVTPEASRQVVVRYADGLSRAMAWQTSFQEPHSILSRGICGITAQRALVINLPGNPAAVKQCLAVLLPVLPQAVKLLRS